MRARQAAEFAARYDWHVVVLRRPSDRQPKAPLWRGWEARASNDPDEVASMWPGPAFNAGIATGRSRLVVVDTDPPDGEGNLARLATGREMPATYTVQTPRGRQRYYALPDGWDIPSSAGVLAGNVDIRARGGLAVAAGSASADGTLYTVADDRAPAVLPLWLAEAITAAHAATRQSSRARPRSAEAIGSRGSYGRGALQREAERVASAGPGHRNAQLNRSAWSLFRLVAAGLLDDATVTAAMEHAAEVCGLTRDDGIRSVRATITSARQAGLASPYFPRMVSR